MSITITLIIIVITALISIKGFSDTSFRHKLIFHPYSIKRNNEYTRFITSGFLHADWLHLIVNMYVLYLFGNMLERIFSEVFEPAGRILYIVLYLTAIVIANLSTYFKHKDDDYYLSLGASGAVSAVLFSTILFMPDMPLMLLFLPIPMPAIVLGSLYLIYSIIMSKRGSKYDNINHEAHYYGAIYGFVFPIVLKPELFLNFIERIQDII